MCSQSFLAAEARQCRGVYVDPRERDHFPCCANSKASRTRLCSSSQGGTEAVAISVWDQQEHAAAYAHGTSLHVLQAVAKVVEGTPQVDIAAVAHATFHKIVSRVAASSGRVFCVRRRRLRPPSLLASQAIWKYAEDPVLLVACCCGSQRSGPMGLLRVHRGVLWPPALLHMRRGHHKEGVQDAHNTGTAV